MVKFIFSDKKTVGFFYYPLLEVGFGIFSLAVAFVFISLFLYFNHSNLFKELFDTIASTAIFVFLLFLGINLTKNYMKVEFNGKYFKFFQCMTAPVNLELEQFEWQGVRTIINKETENRDFFVEIKLKTKKGEILFYNTKSESEANKIVSALTSLHEEISAEKREDNQNELPTS
ncbi:MAG: hypothetical protein GX031_01395 [Candidatus Riflebacteria bacterium]|nr:hypothetical protein [Candidatus Riflebacteria bacterium]